MVARKLNKPAAWLSRMPVFWLHEVVASEWFCRECRMKQEKGSVAFEVWMRRARKGVAGKRMPMEDEVMKTYICMACAAKMLDQALDRVNLVRNLGKEALRMFEEI